MRLKHEGFQTTMDQNGTSSESKPPSTFYSSCYRLYLLFIVVVEEYDPTQPLVTLSNSSSQKSGVEDMDVDEPYDPIISAYSLADAGTLNAEDAPGLS